MPAGIDEVTVPAAMASSGVCETYPPEKDPKALPPASSLSPSSPDADIVLATGTGAVVAPIIWLC